MEYKYTLVGKKDGIGTITFNRPERLNAMIPEMVTEVLDALETFDADDQVRVVVITGAGRAFCAGADVSALLGKAVEERRRGKKDPIRLFLERTPPFLRNMTKPVIASINGDAVGGGCTLACACDIRIAADSARFSVPFVKLGVMPELGSTYNLTRLVGIAKACELFYTGKLIDAKEAKESGLVNQVVPVDGLKPATEELARSIADNAPISIQMVKRALYEGLDTDLATAIHTENLGLDICMGTEDAREGVTALLEKRKPKFKGT